MPVLSKIGDNSVGRGLAPGENEIIIMQIYNEKQQEQALALHRLILYVRINFNKETHFLKNEGEFLLSI